MPIAQRQQRLERERVDKSGEICISGASSMKPNVECVEPAVIVVMWCGVVYVGGGGVTVVIVTCVVSKK